MWDIARAFGTSVSALRRINYIERGSRIYVGQKIKIPSNASRLKDMETSSSPRTYASSGGNSSSGSTQSTYRVRSGDTLWDIARKFGTTTGRIRALNNLGRSSRIYPGQVLKIAGSVPKYVIHQVRRGDTMSKIARRYRTSIARIMANNGKTNPDELIVGEVLKIYTQ
jgi:LysM repeat protein